MEEGVGPGGDIQGQVDGECWAGFVLDLSDGNMGVQFIATRSRVGVCYVHFSSCKLYFTI